MNSTLLWQWPIHRFPNAAFFLLFPAQNFIYISHPVTHNACVLHLNPIHFSPSIMYKKNQIYLFFFNIITKDASWDLVLNRLKPIYIYIQTDHVAHPASCKMGAGSFPAVKCGRGMLLTTHPLLVPLSWKCRAIPLPTIWATPGL